MQVTGRMKVTTQHDAYASLVVTYDRDMKLSYLNIEGPLSASMTLNAVQLRQFRDQLNSALAQVESDSAAIGYDAIAPTLRPVSA